MLADEPSLPDDVLLALRQSKRKEAIELLQVRHGISAQEAEEQVNRYLEENPPVPDRGPGVVIKSKLNALIWLGLILIMALVYLVLVG